jgi:hypothetical protein
MVQLKYFGDSRDYFKYDLITSIFEAHLLNRYTFIPMLTDHRDDKEGNRRPVRKGDKSLKLYDFIMSCTGKSLNHWERWLTPYVLSYHTIKPVDEIFFRDELRANYWQKFRPLVETEKTLVFLDPDTGLQTGTASYRERMGPEKYILNDELNGLFIRLHPESLIMVYQHLPNNKHIHGEATREKLNQVQSVCCGVFTCAYREDDLAFVFVAKSIQIFTRLQHFLSAYRERSKDKYKEIIQLNNH